MKNKKRHGCLTAWLIYLIIANSIVSFVFFFNTDNVPKNTTENMVLLIASIGFLNLGFCILIFNWVKLGFWGIVTTNLILLIIQIVNDHEISHSIFDIICLTILFGLLHLKKNKVSGWKNLE